MLATVGVAHAQPTRSAEIASSASSNGELPWYQRFTSSSGLTETLGADGQQQGASFAPSWNFNNHWGVTVNVREARRVEQGGVEGLSPEQASVGAYYQFTPRMRVGGAVSLGAPQPGALAPSATDSAENDAGVRIESAFRF